jgi:hypothetical protein
VAGPSCSARGEVSPLIGCHWGEVPFVVLAKRDLHPIQSAVCAPDARLPLSVLAYNLGNLWRRLGLPKRIDSWSLTSVQQRLVKTGERLVTHAQYYWLLLAESHLTRSLFGAMLQRIWARPVPTG